MPFSHVQMCEVASTIDGHWTCTPGGMLSFFMLGRNLLPLELTPTEEGCQLSVHHATGVIMERFRTVSSALRRAEQLNDLLSARPRRPRQSPRRKASLRPRRRR
jgi:hypothetical protein